MYALMAFTKLIFVEKSNTKFLHASMLLLFNSENSLSHSLHRLKSKGWVETQILKMLAESNLWKTKHFQNAAYSIYISGIFFPPSNEGCPLPEKGIMTSFFSKHFKKFIKGTLKNLYRYVVPLRRMNLPSKESDD